MTALLAARDICKRFGSVQANCGVSLEVNAGEIHALIGENGAGKSTLVNILTGLAAADSGQIEWRGQAVQIKNPAQARALGIGVVFQKFSLFEPLSVLENIALAVNKNTREISGALPEIAERYGLQVPPNARAEVLSAGEKQRVEILRCLLQKPSLLLMDEPTSVLTPPETAQLFDLLRRLAADGCAIVFISHKLAEVQGLCERVTVLRRGKTVAQKTLTAVEAAVERDTLIRLMMGGEAAEKPNADSAYVDDAGGDVSDAADVKGEEVLTLRGVNIQLSAVKNKAHEFHEVHEIHELSVNALTLKKGVITGVAGIAGNGQEQLLHCINGELPLTAGEGGKILLHSVSGDGDMEYIAIGHWGAGARLRSGILSVPTDRYHTAAAGELSLAQNMLLGCMNHARYTAGGFLRHARLRAAADEVIAGFNITASGSRAAANSLSGGNLQKFIVGRAILQNPRVLAVANPTWGLDVRAADFIRRALRQMAERGAALLVISEDSEELLSLADEIAVLNRGVLSAPLAVNAALTSQTLGEKMTAAV